MPGAGKDQNIAIVDVGANVMQVSVLRNDQSVYSREQAFGGSQLTQDICNRYGMNPEEAENAKRSGLVASLIEKHKVKGLSVAPLT